MALEVRDPRTGEIDEVISAASAKEIAGVARRLRAAQGAWRARGVDGRAAILARFADALAARADGISAALSRDTGRLAIARDEIAGVIASIGRWTALAPALTSSDWTRGTRQANFRHRAHWTPYPLVGAISPWNFPLTLAMIDAVPALLAGCAVVVKPSEVTPRFVAPLRDAIAGAAPLAEVFEVVLGARETGEAMVEAVDAICFTGSVATGRAVAVRAAARLIPAFLELGGKDPLIVLASADLGRAVSAALRGSVLATGQACQSIERLYVARPLFAPFVDALVRSARAVRLNWPDIARGDLGPFIFAPQAQVVQSQLEDAVAMGATILTGGRIERHGGGLWLAPTVVVDVTHRMRLMTEETFGPVMPVMAFETPAEAIALANDSIYGLSAAVIGQEDEALAVARALNAGAVSINDAALTAFFGEAEKTSFGQSGLGGSRMGAAGFTRFLRRQALIVNDAAPAPLAASAEDRTAPQPAR